ncbi:MAG: transposase family protein [Kiritimatiellae bacterium]|nr:transposase family protein [Kiritimatiellia bacterium]
MSKESTKEYIQLMRNRYRKMQTKRAKGKMLDEFCKVTGLERKHAIKVLRSTKEPLRSAGRKPIYSEATEILREIWLLFDQPCSKLLHPVMKSYVDSYENNRGPIDAQCKDLLLNMSPSTTDRLLRPFRVRTSLWRGRGGPMNAMKKQVEVRSERWIDREPGWFEADSVAHCGGSMAGSFAYTLTFTDTDSQWTELRAVWNRGGHATTIRVQEIEKALPFTIKGVNTDNGSEFLNGHLIRYLKNRDVPVTQTRSRPYHKNDNAHVEQKNGSHVRSLLGYDRFDDPDCIESLNEILVLHSLWTNLFRPCMKLVSKVKDGHRYRKKYDKPQTPAQRLLNSPCTTKKVCKYIKDLENLYDCYKLKCEIQDKLRTFFENYVDNFQGEKAAAQVGSASLPLRVIPTGSEAEPTCARKHNRQNNRSLQCDHCDAIDRLPSQRFGVISI